MPFLWIFTRISRKHHLKHDCLKIVAERHLDCIRLDYSTPRPLMSSIVVDMLGAPFPSIGETIIVVFANRRFDLDDVL